MCEHTDKGKLRHITDTRYGPMLGCLACGTSWLDRASKRPAIEESPRRQRVAA